LPDSERRSWLERECNGDAEMLRRVDALLAAHKASENPVDRLLPDADLAATRAYVQTGAPNLATLIAGRYKLLQQIGEGGMGAVWVAEQTEPVKRKVALKLIKPGMDSKAVLARFEAERQALALMDHPNIAKVLDGGVTDQGRPFFVMELVKGLPLTDYCDDRKMSVRERLDLFVQICSAVQHAHQKGIIHRDLKPSNILVTEHDGLPVPKVIDFGLAKALAAANPLTERTLFTAYGTVVGSPLYTAPEQVGINALDVDTRTDVFALGVILYELLTGTTPLEKQRFKEAAWDEMRRVIREEEPQRPSLRLSSSGSLPSLAASRHTEPQALKKLVRGELDWIVMKALEKDRNRRYETANGFAMDVRRHLTGEPVMAVPPSASYRFQKFLRRHRGPVAAVAVVMLALVGGVVGTTIGMFRANRAEHDASEARKDAEKALETANVAKKEAFDALTDLTDNTVGELMTRNPSFSKEQRAFLDRILSRYERLTASLPDDAETLEMRARSLFRVGKIRIAIGDYASAVQSAKQAVTVFRRLVELTPNDAEHAADFLEAMNHLALSYDRLAQKEQARSSNGEGVKLGEEFQEKFPRHLRVSDTLGMLYRNQALSVWHDPTRRLEILNRAVALEERLVQGVEADSQVLSTLLACLNLRAFHYCDQIDVERARADVERMKALLPPDPKPNLTDMYARGLLDLSVVLARAGHGDAAVAPARESVQIREGIVQAAPGNAELRQTLIASYRILAEKLSFVGRVDEAAKILKRAGDMVEEDAAAGRASRIALQERVILCVGLGRLSLGSGKLEDARKSAASAAKAARELLAITQLPKQTNAPEARAEFKGLAQRCNSVANLAEDVQLWDEAIEFGRKQLEFARLAVEPGKKPDQGGVNLVIWAHQTLSVAFVGSGRWDEALEEWQSLVRAAAWENPGAISDQACRHAAMYAEKLTAAGRKAHAEEVLAAGLEERRAKLKSDPNATAVKIQLHHAYRTLSLIYEYSRRFEDAIRICDRVVELGPPEDGDEKRVRDMYVFSHLCRAVCLDALGRDAEAEAAWNDYARQEGKAKHEPDLFRAHRLALNGRAESAVRYVEKHRLHVSGNGRDRFNTACVFAMASGNASLPTGRREEFAGKAVGMLEKAQAVGFFDDRNQIENAKKDVDLDAIRSHGDFKKWLAELTTGEAKRKK
jgi:serine/threonine protein kinase/tetratricopeptide (TPR) repeat protein